MGNDETDNERPHFIPEWAEKRHFKQQADLLRALQEAGVAKLDKGTVSRWYGGSTPRPYHLSALKELFQLDHVRDLFRDPSKDWLYHHFKNRSKEEEERMRRSLELHFPKTG